MDVDTENVLVLTIFVGSIVAVVVGYLVAWRSNRTASRRAGSLLVATVAGFAGLVMSAWLIGAVMPLPPPDGSSIWGPVVAVLVFSPLPLGALYLSGMFIRRAFRENKASGQGAR